MSVSPEAMTQFLSDMTFSRKEKMWMTSFSENLPLIKKESSLHQLPRGFGSALVLGAGPSVNPDKLNILAKYTGTIFTSDKMLIPLLKQGVTPIAVGTVDGDPDIIKYYDDPVVDQHKDEVLAVLATYVYPTVVKRMPFKRFWFNVMFEDPVHPKCPRCGVELKTSLTRAMHWMDGGKTMINVGGNIGTGLTGIAATQGYSPIILYGIDFSYGDMLTPMQTPYWKPLLDERRGDVKRTVGECYRYVNTAMGKRVLTDIVMDSYRETLMKAFSELKTQIINVSPYSIVSGGGAKHMSLEEALNA